MFTTSTPCSTELAIIIPAYNEAENIGQTICDIIRMIPNADVIVISDGSTDATARLARQAGALVIELPFNLGIGGAIQTGYKYATAQGYRIVARLDADGQHDPAQLASLLEPVKTGQVDIAIGSRFIGNGADAASDVYNPSVTRAIGIQVFARLVSLITGQHVTDTTSGFQVCNAAVAAFLARNAPCDYPEVEMMAASCRAGYRIREVPVAMRKRTAGRSSITPVRSVYYVGKVLLALLIGLMRHPAERVDVIHEAPSRQSSPSPSDYGAA